jgi:hypothetical protein
MGSNKGSGVKPAAGLWNLGWKARSGNNGFTFLRFLTKLNKKSDQFSSFSPLKANKTQT